MARSFNGSSDYARNGNAVVTVVPVTIACWFRKSSNAVAAYNLCTVGNSGSANNRNQFGLRFNNQTTGVACTIGVIQAGTAGASAPTYSTPLASENYTNVWVHCGAVFSSATSRNGYFNGVGGTPTTNNVAAGSFDRTTVGCLDQSAQSQFALGAIADLGIWDIALAASDVASLAAGVCPLLVRPESLVAYWPLGGNYSPEIDPVGKFDLTLTGTAKADHPRIFQPRGKKIFLPATSAPPTGNRRRRILLGVT